MAYMSERERRLSQMDKSKILCFDLETTGLDTNTAEILQIAIIDGRGKKLLESLIKPDADDWDIKAQEISGITPETVKRAPKFSKVKNKIQHFFDEADLIIGYNVKYFDLPIIERYGIETYDTEIYDVLYKSKDYFDLKGGYTRTGHSLEETAAHFRYKYKAHDALGDCKATLYIFRKIITDDNLSEYTPSQHNDSNVYLVKDYSKKKSHRKGKLFLLSLVLLIIGVLGVVLSARYISGGFGLSYIFSTANFSNYLFDGFGILALIGLLIMVLVIRSAIRSLRN